MIEKPLVKNNPFAPRTYGHLEKITERVYLFRNITNSSFVVGDDAVAVIDTQVNRPSAERLLQALRSVSDKPVKYVINTHYHWDHTNGNALFKKDGACVISSELTKEFMITRKERQKEFLAGRGFELGNDPFLPEITFKEEYSLELGNAPLNLFFAGRAETDDATAVHVVKENVVMSGDTVMTGSFPIFGQPVWDEGLQGDDRWIRTIEKIMGLTPVHILPGHGPLAHELEIKLLIQIEEFFIHEVKALVARGYDVAQVLQDLEPRLPKWMTDMPVVWGTPRYAILRVFRGLTKTENDAEPGWQKFKPTTIPGADGKVLFQKIKGKENISDFLQMASEAGEGGDAGLKLGILKKAAELFSSSLEILSAYADALIEASRAEASVLEKGDFFKAARQCWDKALGLDPHHTGTLLGKGRYLTMMAYRGGDDPKEGMVLLEKVIAKNPDSRTAAEAEFYLGMGFRRLGDELKARQCFEKAISENPSFMPAHLALQC